MQGGELPQHTRVEVVDVQRRVEPLARVAVATPIRVPHVIARVRVRRIWGRESEGGRRIRGREETVVSVW
jgi:hypothetical protein